MSKTHDTYDCAACGHFVPPDASSHAVPVGDMPTISSVSAPYPSK